ncbi:MAG: YicC/YloC family endoribonuclease [Alphaproteobacteria bacterium]
MTAPPLSGMTGFAEEGGAAGAVVWLWQAKSVNGRGLDLRCRLPGGLDRLEAEVRRRAQARFSRGAVSLNLRLERQDEAPAYVINRSWLDHLIGLAGDYPGRVGDGPPRLEALLAVPGVVVSAAGGSVPDDISDDVLLAGLDHALDGLVAARLAEGAALAAVLGRLLDDIAALVTAAGAAAECQPEAMRRVLARQLADLLAAGAGDSAIDPDRVAQELALLAVKGDVREELDRLAAHIAQARDLVDGGAPAGRRLDFLCQEFNREANTLCAKAQTTELTAIGLDLKQAVDRLREQAQNVE